MEIINKYEGEFDLVSDKYTIDAKSIMGIFSLNLNKPLRLDIHSNSNLEKPEDVFKDYIC